ncbi:interleukin-21 receptor-like [Chanos chanos]|uniref:Interleukin-21 receptor-like n=1 Tax=Chanos chanos TaxID=29144 RepID=A0A6J2WM75_CHACN|nr:interleukin-21 receptor [Chanos chanos]
MAEQKVHRSTVAFITVKFGTTKSLPIACYLINFVASSCNVTCTTDYISTLNCWDADVTGQNFCHVDLECRDEDLSAKGNCTTGPSRRWCTMEPENFDYFAYVDTVCSLTVNERNLIQRVEEKITNKTWILRDFIKPRAPINLNIVKTEGDYNLTWDTEYINEHGLFLQGQFIYVLRIRTKNADEVLKYYDIRQDQKYLVINQENVQSGKTCLADIKASVNPLLLPSFWSEWSSSVELTCPWTSISNDTASFSVSLCVFFPLIYRGPLKKLPFYQYIPNPEDYFKPLYQKHEGDFKKWVGPVLIFSHCDPLEKSAPLQVLSEKQMEALGQQMDGTEVYDSGGSGGEDSSGSNQEDWSLLSQANNNSSRLYFLGGSSLGATHSSGHISIDTVTVSGQEGTVSEWSGESAMGPLDGYGGARQEMENVGEEHGVARLSGREDFAHWELRGQDMEAEQISLESFSSNEQSEYGYPRMGLDLDTIDSGFMESDCSSPVNSEFDGNEQMDSAILAGPGGSHSNYVKQWVTFTTVQGDTSTSSQESQ